MRDITSVFLVALFIFISLQQDTKYILEPSFITKPTQNKPIIADIDADGLNEIILVSDTIDLLDTTALSLGVPYVVARGVVKDTMHLPVRHSVRIAERVSLFSHAVSTTWNSNGIFVLTAGWAVKMYDKKLNLLWKSSCSQDKVLEEGKIVISNTGLVIVAASIKGEHYSVFYAFNEKDGKIVWQHDDTIGPEWHPGEVDWRQYRRSILASMPYYGDFRLKTWHFSRSRGVSKGDDNVVVSHSKAGIEVLHLDTGKMLARLPLPSNGVHLDIDGDLAIDHVLVHCDEENEGGRSIGRVGIMASQKSCWLEVLVGNEQLFNGTLSTTDPLHALSILTADTYVTPVFIPATNRSLDTIVLLSSGHLSSYSSRGHLKWQVSTGCSFTGFGSLSTMLLHDKHAIVCSGSKEVTVIDGKTGVLLSSISLSSISSSPIIGDINSDGHDDLIVQTADGVWHGYMLVRSKGSTLLPGVAGFVTVVAGVVMIIEFVRKRRI